MATDYNIDLTDPKSGSFQVRPFTTNGPRFATSSSLDPQAVSADTSLLFHGKSVSDFGERKVENTVHMLENFAGATPPVNPIVGQQWFKSEYNLRCNANSSWYEWNGTSWDLLVDGVSINVSAAVQPAVLDVYWYNPTSSELKLGHNARNVVTPTVTQSIRSWSDYPAVIDPNTPLISPVQQMNIWTGSAWVDADVVINSPVEPPLTLGGLWFDTGIGELKHCDGLSWITATPNRLELSGGTMTGSLILQQAPTVDLEAATKKYVDDTIGGVSTSLSGISDVSNTLNPNASSRFLTYNTLASEWEEGPVLLSDLSGVNTSAAEMNQLVGINTLLTVQTQLDSKTSNTGDTFTGDIDMSANAILNLLDPVLNQDAATKKYVDDSISGVGGTDTVLSSASFASGTGILTLTLSNSVDINVGGISGTSHTHPSLAADIIANASDIITEHDYAQSRTTVSRVVEVAAAPTSTFTVSDYRTGSNDLQVYLNGIKNIASFPGTQSITCSAPLVNSDPSGLVSGTTYDASVLVDGVVTDVLSIDGAIATTIEILITIINAQLTTSSIRISGSQFIITSDLAGSTSAVVITDGLVDPLFASVANFTSIDANVVGLDYGYAETGSYGQINNQITFTTPVPIGGTVESITLGEPG